MPDTLLAASMLFPSVHLALSWWTFFASGLFEWNGVTFAIFISLLPRIVLGGIEPNCAAPGVITPREYA